MLGTGYIVELGLEPLSLNAPTEEVVSLLSCEPSLLWKAEQAKTEIDKSKR